MNDDDDVPKNPVLHAVAPVNKEPVTPLTYLADLVEMSARHSGELFVALAGVTVVVLTAIAVRSLLHLQASGGPLHVILVLIPFIFAVVLLDAAVAGWRLYRRQAVALATTRSLLDLNAADRTDLERHLQWRYRRREARIHERDAARVGRLDDEITDLQTEAADRSRLPAPAGATGPAATGAAF